MHRRASFSITSALLAPVAAASFLVAIGACDHTSDDASPNPESSQESKAPSKATPDPKATENGPGSEKNDSAPGSGKQDSKKDGPSGESNNEDSNEDQPDEESPDDAESGKEDPDKDDPDKDDPKDEDPDKEDPDKEEPKDSGPIPCEGEAPKVILETNHGTIKLVLDGKRAPNTVANYIQYVNDKYYDSTIFHRVLSKFVVQGGGYDTNNKLKKDRPPIKLEIHPDLKHKAGALAMARTNVKDSATSQFYICVDDTGCKSLDGEYAVFGQTVEGLDVVQKISEVPKTKDGKPHKDVVLNKAYCVSAW